MIAALWAGLAAAGGSCGMPFWDAVGSGAVPEVPLADLRRLDRTLRGVQRCAPPWEAALAEAQLAFLRADAAAAGSAIERAATQCADRDCETVAALRYAIAVDQASSLGGYFLDDVLRTRDPATWETLSRLANAAMFAAMRPPPSHAPLPVLWAAAADARRKAPTFDAVQLIGHDPADFVEAPVDDPLAKSIVSRSFDPRFDLDVLEPAAAGMRAGHAMAPDGELLALGVHPTSDSPQRSLMFEQGLLPRDRATPDVDAALAALASGRTRAGTRDRAVSAFTEAWARQIRGDRAASRALRRSERIAEGLGLVDVQIANHLLRARAAVADDDAATAVAYLTEALGQAGSHGAWGRAQSVIRVWRELAERTFYLDRHYATGDALLSAGLKASRDVDPRLVAAFAESQIEASEHLGLYPEVRTRVAEARAALQAARDFAAERHEDYRARFGKEPSKDGTVAFALLSLIQADANAVAQLGQPQEELLAVFDEARQAAEELDAVTERRSLATTVPGAYGELFLPSWYANTGDFASAVAMLEQSGSTFGAVLAAGWRGVEAPLPPLDDWLASAGPTLPGQAASSEATSLRQYLRLARLFGQGGEVEAALARWSANPTVAERCAAQPWFCPQTTATAHEAAGRRDEAHREYRAALEALQMVTAGEDGAVSQTLRDVEREIYQGLARTAPDAKSRLDWWDAGRWIETQRLAGRDARPTPLQLPRADDGLLVVSLGSLNDGRRAQVSVWRSGGGVAEHRFVNTSDWGLDAELRRQRSTGRVDGIAREVADWLAHRIPAGDAVLMVVDKELRAAGVHTLPVDGTPLALRNPLAFAPSVRHAIQARERRARGRGSVVIGMPITALSDPTREGTLPVIAEAELRGISADRVFWNEGATTQRALEALQSAAVVHISAHGRIDRLRPASSGILLSDGPLTLSRLRALELPGSLVVLSSCTSARAGNGGGADVLSMDTVLLTNGARAVVATPRSVPADVAATWMGAFHGALEGGADAMDAALAAYRATSRAFERPAEWGAFSLTGGW